jgi:hypothetical protein
MGVFRKARKQGKKAQYWTLLMKKVVVGHFNWTHYPSFQACMSNGKFQGMICPTTRTGSWRV